MFRFLMSGLVLASVPGCGPSHPPDANNAAGQPVKAESGVVVGTRPVAVSALGSAAAMTGSTARVRPINAFMVLSGSMAGGAAVETLRGSTKAFEYIVRKPDGDLICVTQRDKTPLAAGQRVLLVIGTQARVVPDSPTTVVAGSIAAAGALPVQGVMP